MPQSHSNPATVLLRQMGAQRCFSERATTEQYLRTTKGLRDHVMDGPVDKMDGYELVLFIAAHCERHTKQIPELKADPNFRRTREKYD